MAKRKSLVERLKGIEERRRALEEEERRALEEATDDELQEYHGEVYQEQLNSQAASAPRLILTVETEEEDHPLGDPASPNPWRTVARVRFEVDVEQLTKEVAEEVETLIKQSDRSGKSSSEPPDALPAALHESFAEIPEALRAEVEQAVVRVRQRAYERAAQKTYGVLHWIRVEPSVAEKPKSKDRWAHPGELHAALYRAIEAIEYRGWQPDKAKGKSRLVRRDPKEARWETVVAYWGEEEGLYVSDDSKSIDRWLKRSGLPNFTEIRNAIRKQIEAERETYRHITEIFGSLP